MSITIQQYPGQLNLANSDMIWEVSSNQTGSAQYQYICVLQSGCGSTLTTIKQQPNPSGYGVFNLGRIVKQYLDYDNTQELFQMGADGPFHKNTEAAKFFKVAFGEEYGTSVSSSVSIYNGIVNNVTGSPAQTGSLPYYYLVDGVIDPNSGDWNWISGSFYSPQVTPSSASFTKNVVLSDGPRTQYAQDSDYLIAGVLNGNVSGSTTTAQDIYALSYTVYNNATPIYSESIFNFDTGIISKGGPRTGSAQLWSSTGINQTCTNPSGSSTSGSLLLYVGLGPQNLSNYGNFDFTANTWTNYIAKLHPQSGSNVINTNATWDTFTIERQVPECGYTGVRFAWINDYGTWDWFNYTLADTKITNLERGGYKRSFVPYNTSTTSVPYDRTRRGNDYYYTNINEQFTVNSDWLTTVQADWIQGMFYSPNVFIQDGLTMLPVVILDTAFDSKTNPKTQKLFKYTVTYALANSKRSR
jgi:hypothetical protein